MSAEASEKHYSGEKYTEACPLRSIILERGTLKLVLESMIVTHSLGGEMFASVLPTASL